MTGCSDKYQREREAAAKARVHAEKAHGPEALRAALQGKNDAVLSDHNEAFADYLEGRTPKAMGKAAAAAPAPTKEEKK